MVRILGLASPAALFFLVASLLVAQSTTFPVQPDTQTTASTPRGMNVGASANENMQYFALEHRSSEHLEAGDADLIQRRRRDVLAEGEFYGYDMSTGGWTFEQSVCPLIPDYVMLRYSNRDANGADSLFTVLIPRNGGRIWTVPVLNHGATRFKPAPIDPRNFQLFSQVVPPDVASKNSGPDGKWLLLSVCYAEMTGAHPLVPRQPGMNIHMIKAPPPTLRVSVTDKDHEVRFVDPVSETDYRLWNISYDEAGRIIDVSDDQHAFGEPVVKTIPEPTPKLMPQPLNPPEKTIPASQQTAPIPQTRPAQPQ